MSTKKEKKEFGFESKDEALAVLKNCIVTSIKRERELNAIAFATIRTAVKEYTKATTGKERGKDAEDLVDQILQVLALVENPDINIYDYIY